MPSRVFDKSVTASWYTVIVLLFAYVLSFVDRIIMSLLVVPIKADLNATDTQMGLLMGLAFAIFYTLVGIPIARLSDVKSRKFIVSAAILLWSLMTAACGLSKSFFQLFLARVGVGVGEAALSPAAYSIIADSFPKEKLGRAISVYQSGALFGGGLAFIIGSKVIHYIMQSDAAVLPLIGPVQAWQMAFVLVGLPGVFMALMMLTVREPSRTGIGKDLAEFVSIKEAVSFIRKKWKVYLSIFFGFAILATPITSTITWLPTYLQRVHGMSVAESGQDLGLILFFLSSSGVFFGGWLVDYLNRKRYKDSYFRIGLICTILPVPLTLLVTTLSNLDATMLLLCPWIFLISMPIAIGPIALQAITPNQLRAQITAVYMLFLNLITALLGPTGIGFITDYLFQDEGAIGQSMMVINLISAPLAFIALSFGLYHYNKN